MATELLLPDSVVSAVNLTAAIADLDEGVDNFDGAYATTQGANGNTLLVLGFPTPTGVLTTGAGLQTFRARVRKNSANGATTTVRIEVYENGTTIAQGPTETITSTTGVDLTPFTWDASILTLQSGVNVEIGIAQQGGGQGGRPNNRRWIEVDTADWEADFQPPPGFGEYAFATIF